MAQRTPIGAQPQTGEAWGNTPVASAAAKRRGDSGNGVGDELPERDRLLPQHARGASGHAMILKIVREREELRGQCEDRTALGRSRRLRYRFRAGSQGQHGLPQLARGEPQQTRRPGGAGTCRIPFSPAARQSVTGDPQPQEQHADDGRKGYNREGGQRSDKASA